MPLIFIAATLMLLYNHSMARDGTTSDVVRGCLRLMLRPVARLGLRYSIHFGDLSELLKQVLVDAAREELSQSGQEISLSKLSVMTGVHRKDVTRIDREPEAVREGGNLIARVMAQWQHDTRFSTKAKRPRVLSVEGRNSEFASLVRSVNGENVSAYSVLAEMERLGAVERRGDTVRLVWRDFIPDGDATTGISMLARDIDDMSQAVEANIFEPQKIQNLHLKTDFDNITPDAVPEVRRWLIEEGSSFHRRARGFLSQFDRDLNKKLPRLGVRCKVTLGTFSLSSYIGEKKDNRREKV